MAKANILKLLKFDEDVREAVTSGRRLRSCTLVQPRSSGSKAWTGFRSTSSLCFIGVEHTGANVGPVVAAAASMSGLNWNQSLKTELDRLSRSSKSKAEESRNRLSETLLEQTTWALGIVAEDEAQAIGPARAAQIAMRRAIDGVIAKAARGGDTAVILINESNLIQDLEHLQMCITEAAARSASVAAAQVVAQTYRECLLETLKRKSQNLSFAVPAKVRDFTPPIELEIQYSVPTSVNNILR